MRHPVVAVGTTGVRREIVTCRYEHRSTRPQHRTTPWRRRHAAITAHVSPAIDACLSAMPPLRERLNGIVPRRENTQHRCDVVRLHAQRTLLEFDVAFDRIDVARDRFDVTHHRVNGAPHRIDFAPHRVGGAPHRGEKDRRRTEKTAHRHEIARHTCQTPSRHIENVLILPEDSRDRLNVAPSCPNVATHSINAA